MFLLHSRVVSTVLGAPKKLKNSPRPLFRPRTDMHVLKSQIHLVRQPLSHLVLFLHCKLLCTYTIPYGINCISQSVKTKFLSSKDETFVLFLCVNNKSFPNNLAIPCIF